MFTIMENEEVKTQPSGEKPVLKEKPELGKEDAPKKKAPKTVTIPGPQTESGKPEKREAAPEAGTSLSAALEAVSAYPAVPQYTQLDFGNAGTLKVEAVSNPHNGLGGAEHDVVLRVDDEKTITLPNIPARYLAE